MRFLVLLLALCAAPALAAEDVPPPPPPPPPPPAEEAPPPATDEPTPAPEAAVEEPPPAVEAKGRSNWAKPAAFIGFGVGAAALALNTTAYVLAAAGAMGGGAAVLVLSTLLTGAGGPVVFVGGRSARWTKSITGSMGLRIGGWIAYGVALALDLAALFYVGEAAIPGGIAAAGSMVMFGLDALFSANEAADVASMASLDEGGVRFSPSVSVVTSPGSSNPAGALVGVAGTF